jgi:hypothetical protein
VIAAWKPPNSALHPSAATLRRAAAGDALPLGGMVHTWRDSEGKMIRNVVLAVVLVFGAVSSPSRAQSQGEVAQQFVGMWRLVSWPQRLSDGTTRQSPISVAYIIYTDTSHMCSIGMNPDRPRWQSDVPTAAEALSAMGAAGLYAYCAKVEVHATEGFVLHHVEIDKSPNLVGRTRKRWFTFQAPNRVALRIDTPELVAPVVESTLIWERVEK